MTHEVDISRSGIEYAGPVYEETQAASGVQATETVVPSKRLAVGKLFQNGIVGVVSASGNGVTPSATEAILCFMQQKYDAMKAIIDNLKPSDREKENIRRRMEEIKRLREDLLAKKLDFEEARQRFVNLLDHEDVAELQKLADREAWKIMG